MKNAAIILAIAAAFSATAAAQTRRAGPAINDQMLTTPGGLQIEVQGQKITSTEGCVRQVGYSPRGAAQLYISLYLDTGDGQRLFAFEKDAIRYVPVGSSFSSAGFDGLEKWSRILDTVERAAAEGRPLTIAHRTLTREVGSLAINWTQTCG